MTGQVAEAVAMARALDLARTPGLPLGPNPRVGCVLLDAEGRTVAEGHHRGAGTPHAEADALARAGERARGTTAVVTLEPCDHTGRTGPCSQALLRAGVTRVVYAVDDPHAVAHGGAETLRRGGVEVSAGLLADEAAAVNRAWAFGLAHARPLVTWKTATTLDGRSAAADGTSRWISSTASRADAQQLRAACDTLLVGTGTVLADDPRLTARDADDVDLPPGQQLTRAVMGRRDVPAGSRVLDGSAPTVLLATRDPHEALATLFEQGRRHVLLEGGPTLAAAFLTAGLVDEVVAYVAPLLLGGGRSAVGDLGIATLADALHLELRDVRTLVSGPQTDLRLTLVPAGAPPPDQPSPEPPAQDQHPRKKD